jgi:hemolysin III
MAELTQPAQGNKNPSLTSQSGLQFWLRLKEPVSGLTHLAAMIFSLAGGAWLVRNALQQQKPLYALGFGIFSLGLVLLYSASSAYHLLRLPPAPTRWLRRIDHMMIYVLIASTYTPFCLVVLPGAWGVGILAAIWGLAAAGVLLSLFYLEKPRWLTVAIYIFMGWFSLVAIRPLVEELPPVALFWVALGGVVYTVGAVIYTLKRPRILPGVFGFHEVWHLFVMGGSFCHYMAMVRIN